MPDTQVEPFVYQMFQLKLIHRYSVCTAKENVHQNVTAILRIVLTL